MAGGPVELRSADPYTYCFFSNFAAVSLARWLSKVRSLIMTRARHRFAREDCVESPQCWCCSCFNKPEANQFR